MQFALVALDRPNHVAQRMEIRPEHLEFLASLGDKLVMCGPFLNDAGEGCGSIVILEADSLEDAREKLSHDPYAKAGLFEQVTVKPWRLAINNTTK
jgi:hypothetical protein